jgi:AcrR family transcriptional regulator
MRSLSDDRTAAARVRDEAMRLFAERGVAAVSLRDIAAAAGVSAPLVIHHYGSKDGLKTAVDEYATGIVEEMFELVEDPDVGRGEFAGASSVMSEMLDRCPALMPYLRRLLVDGGGQAERLFASLYEATRAAMARLRERGVLRGSADGDVQAAFLLVNDLGAVLLRDQIRAVTGVDPLEPPGLERWGAAVLEVYARGIFRADPEQEAADV